MRTARTSRRVSVEAAVESTNRNSKQLVEPPGGNTDSWSGDQTLASLALLRAEMLIDVAGATFSPMKNASVLGQRHVAVPSAL
jgi:hypothetical protein